MSARELVDLPIEQALDAKWQRGQAKYGPTWAGEHPLIEAHSEALDGIVYCREAARRGISLPGVERAFRSAVLMLRAAIRGMDEKSDPPPKAAA